MMNRKYSKVWIMFVKIKPRNGMMFNDLIDMDDVADKSKKEYIGAWANILIKAETINIAIDIAPLGLEELDFEIEIIDKVENTMTLIENLELKKEVIEEIDWLLSTDFVFKISDRLFPFT